MRTRHTQTGPVRPVCVVTAEGDITADRLILHLHDMGVPVLRFDLADFPERVALDAVFTGTRWTGQLTVGDRRVRLETIAAVWWWHPTPIRIGGGTAQEAAWSTHEATAGFVGVLDTLPDCLHVNAISATAAAQSKPDVLTRAAQCGLRVPPTWIGNAPSRAAEFTKKAPDGAVYKTLVNPGITTSAGFRRLLTQSVDADSIDASAAATAHQFQHRIPKTYEVRLTVVGQTMFAARIDAHSDAAKADFRADYSALTYAHVDIPDDIRHGIRRLMDAYGLVYAAIDLIVDASGRWWLLDVNPGGQHDWLQHNLPDLPITESLARLLARASHPTGTVLQRSAQLDERETGNLL